MHDGSILSQHPRMLTCSTRLVRESRLLMNDGWRATVTSRRRIFRRRAIAGGSCVDGRRDSGLPDNRLHVRIRSLLLGQTLPPVDGSAWAGNGSGANQCACCGATISASHQEFEPESATGLYAHAECFMVWRAESYAQNGHQRQESDAT